MLTIEALEAKLNKNELDSLYLFYGEEIFLLESAVKKIKKLFGELVQGINYIMIDENNIKELISDIETPAFGFEKKLIMIRNSGILKKEGKRKDANLAQIKEEVNKYIVDHMDVIKESNILIFIEEEVEKLKLYKTIDKNGCVCEFNMQKPLQIGKRLKAICNAYHVKIADQTIMYLIEECGSNMQNLIQEIRKLIEYVGTEGTIQKEDVDKLCTKQIQAVIFDLTDNLGKKNVAGALEVLNGLLFQKEPIQKIFITLYNHFKKLYFVTLAQKEKKDIATALKLKPNQMFLVGKYKNQASFFEAKELRKLLEELENLDANYKIGIIDLNLGLESILCRYCSK